MLSRLLVPPQNVQQLRPFTLSAIHNARSGFPTGGTGLAYLQSLKEAFQTRLPNPFFREQFLGPKTGKPFKPLTDMHKGTGEDVSSTDSIEDEQNKTNLSDWEQMLDWKYGQYKPYEFVFYSEMTEKKLTELGETFQIEHLGPSQFPSPAFPVEGQILPDNTRLMVPLVCQWKRKPNKPSINVWFMVDTGAPTTYLTVKTIEKLVDDTNIHIPHGIQILIQDKELLFPCDVSRGYFNETNLLGMDVMRELKLSVHNDWKTKTFKLYNELSSLMNNV